MAAVEETLYRDGNPVYPKTITNQVVDKESGTTLPNLLNNKQDTLVSGTTIKTVNGNSLLGTGDITISSSGTISVDTELSTTSTNPVQNKVITNAVNTKQDTLVSGTSIKTINNNSLLGSGNITIEGSSGTSDYTALTNKPSINSIELSGNKTLSDLNIASVQSVTDEATARVSADLLKEDISNKTTTLNASSTDTQYPSSKVVYDNLVLKASDSSLTAHTSNTSNPHSVTKSQVGLSNVDNTSDISKPVSTATQTALDTLETSITKLIPTEATETNKLADKDFVNSSISTATATFKGTFASTTALPTTDVDNNDYAFVTSTDTAGNTLYNRYKYDGDAWAFEYSLNNSSFTSEQWAAIQSGITTTLVTQITTNQTDIASEVTNRTTADTTLQNTLTSHTFNISNPHSVTKTQVGLGNVDNTSDLNKPISTATQTALDTKVNVVTGKDLSTNDYTTDDKAIVDRANGINSVTTLVSIPIDKNVVVATLSVASTLSLASALSVGQAITIVIIPTATFDLTLPSTGGFTSLDDVTMSLTSGKLAEISILCYGSSLYSLSSKIGV